MGKPQEVKRFAHKPLLVLGKGTCPNPATVLCLEQIKKERERYCQDAYSLTFSHKQILNCRRGLWTLCLCWNRADIAGPFRFCGNGLEMCGIVYFQAFLRPNRPSGAFCKAKEVFLCPKFCCLQTISSGISESKKFWNSRN